MPRKVSVSFGHLKRGWLPQDNSLARQSSPHSFLSPVYLPMGKPGELVPIDFFRDVDELLLSTIKA